MIEKGEQLVTKEGAVCFCALQLLFFNAYDVQVNSIIGGVREIGSLFFSFAG